MPSLQLNCETDFVARNEKFVAMADTVAAAAVTLPAGPHTLSPIPTEVNLGEEDKVTRELLVCEEFGHGP